MNNNYDNILYSKPDLLNLSKQDYINQIKQMIINAIQKEPTILLHTDQEILEKYNHSVVAKDNDKIVGNANLYPTQMQELTNLSHPDFGKINIGELGSVIVDENYRSHNIGNNLIKQVIKTISPNYDAVVSATVNDRMVKIFKSHDFVEIPFPKQYFQEGKIHLGPKMPGGVEEFTEKAKCFMLFNKDIKEYILETLNCLHFVSE